VLVKTLKRAKIPGFLKKYSAGEHLELPICEAYRGTAMRVAAPVPTNVNRDGECDATEAVSFTVLPGAVMLVRPAAERK